MKSNPRKLALCSLGALALTTAAHAQLTIPGANGSDGALVVTETNTVIDLSQAVTAVWNVNNAANAGKGVYDSNKWAVVFKYSSVSIAAGASVTFINHPSRAPVVWLVSGNVTINGTVSLDGQNYVETPGLAEPGPGGFRGGFGGFGMGVGQGAGFGPGGGGVGFSGGSYGSIGDSGSSTYGNPSLLPLLGGSGGSGDYDRNPGSCSGGAGGGAILIACSNDVFIGAAGSVRSKGGNGGSGVNNAHSGGGSGGAVRIVCRSLSGAGWVDTSGGTGYRSGGVGRIRIERVNDSSTLALIPDAGLVNLLNASTPLIWLPEDGPTARVVSIGSVSAPADPRASFGAFGPDVAIPETATTQVVVETTNVEPESQVIVRVTPRANADFREVIATSPTVITPNPLVIRWTADVAVTPGNSAVQVRVKRP